MPFAAALSKALKHRGSEVPAEFVRGDSLEDILNRDLMTVEEMGGDDVFTCILLLSADGKRLSYGAAPTIPASYSRASDCVEIGPHTGSCGAAAYLDRPVYSIDIATDPVWRNSRDVALQHGFRSCWSTPIRNSSGSIIGTFAILHRTVGMPTPEEIEAIDFITEHVATAIMWFRNEDDFAKKESPRSKTPLLRLVCDNQEAQEPPGRLLALAKRLQANAADLDQLATRSESESDAEHLRNAAELSRKLGANINAQIDRLGSRKPVP